MANEVEWDDIHTGGVEPPANPEPRGDDEDIESQVVNDDDELERVKTSPEDIDDIPEGKEKPDGTKVEPEVPVSENMSGIEMYLSQFDIEGGIINFEDGSSVHFNDLDAAKQAEVLQSLHGAQATAIEDQYGLEEEEVGLINYLRENNLSVEEMVEQMVEQRVSTMMSMQELASEDYATMDPDALYVRFLAETSPEATAEQIASDLAKAKELSNFSKVTESLRGQFVQRQEQTIANAQQAAVDEHVALIEEQRQQIVNAVLPMNNIAGITLDQNIKNTVLDHILQVNDEGDSTFMDEVFTEPENLFKAAFWYVYGESIVAQRDEYWKKEKSAAYKRGKEDALGVTQTPQSGRSFTSNKPGQKQEPHTTRAVARKSEEEEGDWSDIHQL